ncbi:hypothetical protein [Streptomyces aureocirculatus]|uniref:hypothetical protein n=1 Tax=Streptomyces aureocirculatus TaxID=67275 RepID=UPI000ACE5106|nr:hypothetical protein [Streptomyces aureocirculatus]
MTEDTHGPHGRPPDSAVARATAGAASDTAADVAEHLAAAIGTDAWSVAHAGTAALLDPGDGSAVERIRAWAAEAERRDSAERDEFLMDSVPHVQQELASALAAHPQHESRARRLTDAVHALLAAPEVTAGTADARPDTTASTAGTPPDATASTAGTPPDATASTAGTADTADTADTAATQFATADGHGTVNAVQHGNIYHQVVLGLAERPRRMSRGATGAVVGVAGAGAAVAGTAAARHLTGAEVDGAAGDLPQGPLADPAAPAGAPGPPPSVPPPPPGPPSVGAEGAAYGAGTGGSVSGGAVVTKATSVFGKVAGALGAGGGGVSVPAVVTLVSVVVVAATSVGVVVSLPGKRASCDSAVDGRSAPAALAEAARRTGLTSYRFTVHRGTHRVMGAADPRVRSAWFTQRVGDGPSVAGTIARGKVTLPAGTLVPAGADRGLVRSDGAFTDAVDPTSAARLLRSVTAAERDGCEFEGTLRPASPPPPEPPPQPAPPSPSATPSPSAAPPSPATPVTSAASAASAASARSARSAAPSSAAFTARIDKRGRLVRLVVDAVPRPGGAAAVSARYSHFGLAVTPSVPPTPSAGPASSAPAPDAAVRLDGRWTGIWSVFMGGGTFDARLKEDGGRITGDLTVSGITGCDLDGALTGTLKGDRITFGSAGGGQSAIAFTGTVHGDSMKGEFSTGCQGAKGDWTAERVR